MASISCQWGHTHDSVDAVKDCHYWNTMDEDTAIAEALAEQRAENSYVQHMENVGWAEAALDRRMEDARGVVQFSDAWDLADPSRIADREAAR
jgi:hypothetical protein